MQLGGIRLSPTERRIINRLCLYCGAAGHFASSCQLKASSSVDMGVLASATVLSSPQKKLVPPFLLFFDGPVSPFPVRRSSTLEWRGISLTRDGLVNMTFL